MFAGEHEDLGEVGVRISLCVEHVGRVADRNRLFGEAFASASSPRRASTFALTCRQSISLPTSTPHPARRDRPRPPPRRARRARTAPARWSPRAAAGTTPLPARRTASTASEANSAAAVRLPAHRSTQTDSKAVMFASRTPGPRSASSPSVSLRASRAPRRTDRAWPAPRHGRRGESGRDRTTARSRRSTRAASEAGVGPKKRKAAVTPGHRAADTRAARACASARSYASSAAPYVRDRPPRAKCGVGDEQGHLVGRGLEHRQCLVDERDQFLRSAFRFERETQFALLEPSAQLADTVTGCRGAPGQVARAQQRLVACSRPEEGRTELDFEHEVDLGLGHERAARPSRLAAAL